MSHRLRPGDVIAGDYKILRKIARGGMGVIYEVEQISTGRRRALKALAASLVEDPKSRARFEREVRLSSRINSDHIAQVFAAGIHEPGGIPWIVMELLDGEDLKARVDRVGPLPSATVLDIFEQIGHALARAHEQQIIHFDLKPENLFMVRPRNLNGRPLYKILDFGIAKMAFAGEVEVTSALGSPFWLAPEQLNLNTVARVTADVWPLGLIAFYLLTGQHYWRAEEGGAALLLEMLDGELEPPSQRCASRGFVPPLGRAFDAWFAGCVVRDPSRRFGSTIAAIDALRAALIEDESARSAPTKERLLYRGPKTLPEAEYREAEEESCLSHSSPTRAWGGELVPTQGVEETVEPGSTTWSAVEIAKPRRVSSRELLAHAATVGVVWILGCSVLLGYFLVARNSEPSTSIDGDLRVDALPVSSATPTVSSSPRRAARGLGDAEGPERRREAGGVAPESAGREDEPLPSPAPESSAPLPAANAIRGCIHQKRRQIARAIRRDRGVGARVNEDLVTRVSQIRCLQEHGRPEEASRRIRSFLLRYPRARISSRFRRAVRRQR